MQENYPEHSLQGILQSMQISSLNKYVYTGQEE